MAAAPSQPIAIAHHARAAAAAAAPGPSPSPPSPGADGYSVHPHQFFVGSFGHTAGSHGGVHGSFGSRFYPGCSPGQLLNPLDPNDFMCKLSSSIESDHTSLIRALNGDVQPREDEMCRNYTCCGLELRDLHALVEHFEDAHVVVIDAITGTASFANLPPHPPYPPPALFDMYRVPRSSESSLAGALGTPPPPPHAPLPHPALQPAGGAFDADDMDMELDLAGAGRSPGTSPPDTPQLPTPVSPRSPFAHSTPYGWGAGAYAASDAPPAAFDTTAVHAPKAHAHAYHAHGPAPYAPERAPHRRLLAPLSSLSTLSSLSPLSLSPASPRAPRPRGRGLNGYAGYADYSAALPGAFAGAPAPASPTGPAEHAAGAHAVAPALLFAPLSPAADAQQPPPLPARAASRASTPRTSPGHSRSGSPASASGSGEASAGGKKERDGEREKCASTTLSRPASALLLSKPFRCPKEGCMKSYKQANGLKYHMTHGSCNFSPPAELASVEGLSERDAERRLRPFCCQVPPCQRRYKNMNGLRYHYQHSGDHGALGLALLASGNHDATKSQPSPPSISLDTSCAPPQEPAPASASALSQPPSAYASPWGSPRAQHFAPLPAHQPLYHAPYTLQHPTPQWGAHGHGAMVDVAMSG